MDLVLLRKKDLTYEGLVWFFLMMFLAMLSFSMLVRDAKKQFGAVSFGAFPSFTATDGQGKAFDQHKLHGQLSTIIMTESKLPEDVRVYLSKLSQATASGRKILRNLVLVSSPSNDSDPWMQYLTLSEGDFIKLKAWDKGLFQGGIILVDQNGIIRGVFNLDDKLQRINFEAAVRGIL